MKQLNGVLEKSLERANNKKMAKLQKDGSTLVKDKSHQVLVKENEIKNN